MSLNVVVDGVAILDAIQPSSIDASQLANDGQAAFGGFAIEDEDAGLITTGHRPVVIEETACSQRRLFTGWTTERDLSRSVEDGLQAGADARLHDVTIVDLNASMGFRLIRGGAGGGNRPEENWSDRLAWIIGITPVTSYVTNVTDFVFSPVVDRVMDAADYRGSYPAAVFDDLIERIGDGRWTWFVFWDPASQEVALFIGSTSEATTVSSLYISNVLSDVNGTTVFAPDGEAKLARTPDQVYSDVMVTYANGRVFRRRQSTEVRFTRRGARVDRPRIKKRSTAIDFADAWLSRHDSERDTISVTIIVPPESAGLAYAGQRINVKFTHLDGYEDWTALRITSCTARPLTDVVNLYALDLELVNPQAGGAPPAGGCPDSTPSDTWNSLGSATSDADGNLMYLRTGVSQPTVPTPFHVGSWNFPAYGASGCEFMADFAGDCASNFVRVAVVGAGTLRIVTHPYECDHFCDLTATVWHAEPHEGPADSSVSATAGNTFTVTIPADGYCNHWIDLTDDGTCGCGSKWGFVSATWTLGEVDDDEDFGSSQTQTIEATTDPTVNDDEIDGYIVGQMWVNTTTGEVFVLVDATAGAAVWVSVTASAVDTVEYANSSGGTLAEGDLVVFDASADASVTTTTTPNLSTRGAGIARETIYNGSNGRITTHGYVPKVNLNGSNGTRGNFLFTSQVAKSARSSATRAEGAFGLILSSAATPPSYLFGVPDASISALLDTGAFTYLDGIEASAPGTPASGRARLYVKADGRFYSKDDGGTEYGPFDAAGSGTTEPAYDIFGTSTQYAGNNTNLSAWGTGSANTANKAYYIPFVLNGSNVTAKKVWYVTGGTTTGAANIDIGIYSSGGTRLVSTGSTAWNQNNNSTFTVIDISDTALTAGTLYYLAIVLSSVTNVQLTRWDVGGVSLAALGVLVEASALPLPATATFALPTTENFLPYFGILARSEPS